jgi:hypothetical protein
MIMKKNRYLIHQVIFLLAVALVFSTCSLVQNRENNSKIPIKTGNYFRDVFLADGDSIITRPQHLGIVNGMGSVGIAYDYVGVINGFWAPPYVSSDFFIEPRLWGERVKTPLYLAAISN